MDERTLHPPGRPFRGTVTVPGDKSLSHRALLFAALTPGRSPVSGLGPGADVASTAAALGRVGVAVGPGFVESPGAGRFSPPGDPLDCGNSGTTLRLLAGVLGAGTSPVALTGDASLRRRPMRRLVVPLGALGIDVATSGSGTAPITVCAPGGLHRGDVAIPIASAQVRSAFELAAVQGPGPSIIDGPPGFRDHTERWLTALGRGSALTPTRYRVEPGRLPAARYDVPGDPSSAAFLWAAAALVPGARVEVPGVSLNPGRTGFLDVLAAMGATVEVATTGSIHGDPVGTVAVTGAGLTGTTVAGEVAARALDELPLVAVLGMVAVGETTVSDASELRAKESDRIATSVEMVRDLGGDAEPTADGFVVRGDGRPRGGAVDSHGDHRIAMAAAVAASAATGAVRIVDPGAASVSWPDFYTTLEALWSSR